MDNSKVLYIKNENCFLYDNKKFTKSDFSQSKKYFTALLVPPSALYMYSQKVSSNIEQEQKEVDLDIAMYEEGGADENEDYQTAFITHKLPDGNDDLAELFGITHNESNALYSNLASKVKAIDLIAPSFLIYESLYDEEVKSTDLYLYFADEEAYGVLYMDGKYKAYRGMDNLAHLSSQCGWDLDTLKAALKTRGINEVAYEEHEMSAVNTIQTNLTRSVERIVHTINHKRGLFGFDNIDRIFIDFEGESILGLETIFHAFEINIDLIEPIKAQNNTDPHLCHDVIAAKYLLGVGKEKYQNVNVSIYERELPLYKKPAGHFLGILLLSILLCVGYVFYLQYELDKKNEELVTINAKIEKLSKSSKLAKMKIKKLNKDKQEVQKELAHLTKQEKSLSQAKDAVPFIKDSSIRRQELIDNALMGLSKNSLGVTKIDQNGSKKLFLHIATTKNKQTNIANFMGFMAKRGYQRSFTKEIQDNNGTYESIVEIVR